MEKAPLKKPLAAFRKNVLSQKLWGVGSLIDKFEALELIEETELIVEAAEEVEE